MWLHLASSVTSPSVLAEAGSISESDSHYQRLAQCCSWREKLRQPQFWRRRLTADSWLRRLSGLTSEQSTLERGVASFRASLADSPASRFPSPASGKGKRTNATSGQTFSEWYTTLRQTGYSLRTYQPSFPTIGEPYDPTYASWATRLRRASSARNRSARRIFGSASSSWPTARASEGDKQPGPGEWNDTLTVTAQNWPTPDTMPEAPNLGSNKKSSPPSLGGAADQWQTPATDAFRIRGGERVDEAGLDQQARMWPTPQTHDVTTRGNTEADHHHYPHDLSNAVETWSSPPAHDGRRPGSDATSTQGRNLKREAESSLPAQVATGKPGSEPGRVLNPRFVEMLMGWPSGLINYESSATASCLWRQHMRYELSRLEAGR